MGRDNSPQAKELRKTTRKRAPPAHAFKPGVSGNPKGRPKGQLNGGRKRMTLTEHERRDLAARTGITPLEFLMSVLRDPNAKFIYKVECAKVAAPYMHRRMPIAIEGGDPTKPILLDNLAMSALNRTELAALQAILVKAGVLGVTIPTSLPNPILAEYARLPEDKKWDQEREAMQAATPPSTAPEPEDSDDA